METKIIKSKKKVNWRFPCKGISKTDNTVIGFSSYGTGTVLDIGQSYYKLYYVSDTWNMDNFQPIEEEKEEEKQPVDWGKIELPILAKNRDGNLIQITSIKGAEIKYKRISDEIVLIIDVFPIQGLAKQWLNSLEILPKGTKIEITI